MKILQIDGNGRIVHQWEKVSDAAETLNLDSSHIYKCLTGKRSTHGGYNWKYSEGDVDIESNEEGLENKTFDYSSDKAVLSAKTEKSITSLEEAIEFFEIDTDKWEIDRFIVNSWDVSMKDELNKGCTIKRTNYQVKVYLKLKQLTVDEIMVDLGKELDGYTPKNLFISKGSGVITVELSDFHIGADIRNLTRTKDFNIKILGDYLYSIADIVNSYKSEAVIVNLHGDFFESISGLNHDDTFKGIGQGMYGANVIILANELIGGILLSNIVNLVEINIVSGNHDRISSKNTVDTYGEGAKLLAFVLKKDFPELSINYDKLIIVREIDGINHILTHGHHGLSKKDLTKIVVDYGNSKIFNLWTEGHLHTRTSRKVLKSKVAEYKDIEFVTLDELKYRKLVLPPVFTGNFFSESIGYAGHAGVVITYNNGKGIPNIQDYTI